MQCLLACSLYQYRKAFGGAVPENSKILTWDKPIEKYMDQWTGLAKFFKFILTEAMSLSCAAND